MTDFDGIAAPLAAALTRRGYDALTPVQTAVLDAELNGADALVSAQTGSGKTVAFGLAIAPTLLGQETRLAPAMAPLALIIAPTRELALQVARELEWLYADTGARMATCVGGMDYRTERRALERGAHIVVGTPGRLRDHLERGALDLSAIRAVVLDEADEMLDMGFREDLEEILQAAPADRRTLLFSATVPKGIAELARSYQRDAVRISTAGERKQHGDIEYRALSVVPRDRENAIINTLRFYEARMALVFCKTRAEVNRLLSRFTNRGFSVVALSGELSQTERMHALQALRDGRARVCIATDVAARGIDLPGLELVIHADLPSNSETLLHRSGRTGRAGQKGVSALIVTPGDYKKANRLLSGARISAEWAPPPSAEEVGARDDERLLSSPTLTGPVAEDEAPMVARLVEGFTPEALAAAFLRQARAGQSAPEEIAPAAPQRDEAPRPPREAFGDAVWFSLSVGHEGRAEARWLLPKLCDAGGITRNEIGAIRVQRNETFVQISAQAAEGFVATLGAEMALEPGLTVTPVEGEPVLERPERAPRPDRGTRAPREDRAARAPREDRAARGPREDRAARAPRKPREDKSAWGDRPARGPRDDRAPATGDPAPRKEPRKDWGERKAEPFVPLGAEPPVQGKKAHRAAKYADRDDFKPARRVGVKPKRRDDAEGEGGARPAWKAKDGGKPATRGKPGKPAGKPVGKAAGKPGAKPAPRAVKGADASPSRAGYRPADAMDTSKRLKPRSKPGKKG